MQEALYTYNWVWVYHDHGIYLSTVRMCERKKKWKQYHLHYKTIIE